jgi:DmsE family decaheme c-type cytochrome
MRRPFGPTRWVAALGSTGAIAAVFMASTTGATATREVNWPALNPAYEGATYVKDPTVCASCHEADVHAFDRTRHAQVFKHRAPEGGECESCHGPRSKHVETPDAELSLKKLTAAQQSSICLQCHQGGARMGWKTGAHQAAEVSCSSCHYVMDNKSERFLLARAQGKETCFQCHGDVRAKLHKNSHHPVREGRMDCADCHNVHGSGGPGMLKAATVNDTCYTCHADKRGPFAWEHAPVRESCANCHDAHGSSNRGLLVSNSTMLCLQCHSYGGHINLPRYNRTSNMYGTGCTNCHLAPHGSNHPSGAKLTR